MSSRGVAFVIDDDDSIRDSLKNLFRSVGLEVETFKTAREFLSSQRPNVPSCVVLDVRLPGLSGLELQRQLGEENIQIPIIFITGHGDVPMSVRAMKAGAVEFLTKPFRDQDLLDAVQEALDRDRAALRQRAEITALREQYRSLTSREQEVMKLVVRGFVNKQIAEHLAISEPTVKLHRGRVMHKMGARSLSELIRIAEKLGIDLDRQRPTAAS